MDTSSKSSINNIEELVPISRPFPISIGNNTAEFYISEARRVLDELSSNPVKWADRCGRSNFSLEMSLFVTPRKYWKYPSPIKEIFGAAELFKPYSFILQLAPILDPTSGGIIFAVVCFDYDKLVSLYDIYPSLLLPETPTIFRYVRGGITPRDTAQLPLGVYVSPGTIIEVINQSLEEDTSIVDICGDEYHFISSGDLYLM